MLEGIETVRFGNWFAEYVEEGDVKVLLALYYDPPNTEQSSATPRELDLLRQVCISFGFTEAQLLENLT